MISSSWIPCFYRFTSVFFFSTSFFHYCLAWEVHIYVSHSISFMLSGSIEPMSNLQVVGVLPKTSVWLWILATSWLFVWVRHRSLFFFSAPFSIPKRKSSYSGWKRLLSKSIPHCSTQGSLMLGVFKTHHSYLSTLFACVMFFPFSLPERLENIDFTFHQSKIFPFQRPALSQV